MNQHHNHQPRLVQSHHVHHVVHGAGRWGRFNTWMVKRIASLLGNMNFFWFCVLLDIAMLPSVIQSGSVTLWVTYLAQTVIQLLALPALGAAQNLAQVAADEAAKAQFETITAIHSITVHLDQLQTQQMEILKKLGGPGGS